MIFVIVLHEILLVLVKCSDLIEEIFFRDELIVQIIYVSNNFLELKTLPDTNKILLESNNTTIYIFI